MFSTNSIRVVVLELRLVEHFGVRQSQIENRIIVRSQNCVIDGVHAWPLLKIEFVVQNIGFNQLHDRDVLLDDFG